MLYLLHDILQKQTICHLHDESHHSFFEETLFLRVNRDKTKVGYVQGMKFLGYSFYKNKSGFRLSVHPKSYMKLKVRLNELTRFSNGMGHAKRKYELHQFIRGWIEYLKLADMQHHLKRIDKWLRPRLRMCIWKYRKKIKTRFNNLIRCGIDKIVALRFANSRQSYWCMAGHQILNETIGTEALSKAGYPCLTDYYYKIAL